MIQWFAVIALNASVAIIQQARARKQLAALEKLTAARCKVIRGGTIREISAEDVVPGDIILLEQGDRVPADAILISSVDLHVNQSTLTGESADVEKSEKGEADGMGRPKNKVYLGTYATSGSGVALVTETGKTTELGRISSQLEAAAGLEKLHLRMQLNRIAKYLSTAIVIFLVTSLAYKFAVAYARGQLVPANTLLLAGEVVRTLITAMSIMPINIPLLTTIVLVTGVLAMARNKVVVRDLNSIETFSRISVVCTDKTGTLTKGEMTARWLCFPTIGRAYSVKGIGYAQQGTIVEADSAGTALEELAARDPEQFQTLAAIRAESPLWYLLVCGLIDNVALRVEVSDAPRGTAITQKLVGNLTDVALIVLFSKSGIDEAECRSRFETVQSFPFDSRLKRMTRVCRDTKRGNPIVFTKGAIEAVLPLCASAATAEEEDGPGTTIRLDDASRTRIVQAANAFAVRGYRVISFCYRLVGDPAEIGKTRESVEQHLVYLGFAAILDPPTHGIRESVLEAEGAGVKPVMITGDNPETARTIAEEVGIARPTDPPSTVVTGPELQSCSEEKFLEARVFARTSPEDKMVIVQRYKNLGRPVAMTGDGVNDALALSAADIGIAMGQTGTEVAKQSADIILADDSFESIVQGIRQGRGIFQKIRSIIFFYIAVNLAEAIVYFSAEFIPGFILLNAWQHILILITAHSFPPFALIVDHLNRDVMREKPKEREGILSRRLLVAMFLFATPLAAAFLLAYLGALSGSIPVNVENKLGYFIQTVGPGASSWEQAKARTLLIAVALIAESLLVLSLRRINKTIPRMLKEEPRWPAWGLILFPVVALILLMYVPSIQVSLLERFGMNFELVRLSPSDWGAALLLTLIPIAFFEVYKVYLRRSGKEF